MDISTQQILTVLNEAASRFEFPMLDNGYIYPVDVRLSAYSDRRRWAIVIEHMGVNNRTCSYSNDLYGFGNCLRETKTANDFVSPEAFRLWRDEHEFDRTVHIYPVNDGPSAPLVQNELIVTPAATNLLIRDKVIPITRNPADYLRHGVTLSEPPPITLYELMRCLSPDHRAELVATEEELQRLVPADLPLLLRLDQWLHPALANEVAPGSVATFIMIAAVLVSGQASAYDSRSLTPNTHWSNWHEGGSL